MRRTITAAGLLAAVLSTLSVAFWTGTAAAECQNSLAVAVSVQGSVQARRAGETRWGPVRLNDTYCAGDVLRVDARSRAAIVLRTGGVLRLDQNTTITFSAPRERQASWIELLRGAVYFITRISRGLNVQTPYVNATVEGTEFWVEVTADQTTLTVLEGRVTASNTAGSVTLVSRESAVARAGQAPALRPIVVLPADAVQWALYYPPLLTYGPGDFPDRPRESWPALVRSSIELAARQDLEGAFVSLAEVPADVADPRVFVYRAGLLLNVGRVDEAVEDLAQALRLAPRLSDALALRSIVAVARNEKAEALRWAEQAVQADPSSTTARVALSYAQQAGFDLDAALASAREAVRLQAGNALSHARLAELLLSFGELDQAVRAAREAVRLDPALARAQTVLGFASLAQIELADAAAAFEQAIRLDEAASLPRLGLGLTKIRRGALEDGREQLEIAVSLDPRDSLLRSYLGKAYYEEKSHVLAAEQFSLAERLDPQDPTPLLYEAMRLQSVNRPVEALEALQRSIALNDNRAVYRSRQLLDQDLATRSASLARIYDDLGFKQLALAEGWKSLGADPANASAHHFLADSYSVLPRHDVARVSEVLQSQLLQPLTIAPVQPQLALSDAFVLAGTGPANSSFSEFTSLFERNRFAVLASGVAGGNNTFGDELVLTALHNRLAVSVGQFHYQTDGFRPNNDLTRDIYNVFGQLSLSNTTSILAEFRSTHVDQGDLFLRFDPENFRPTQRQEEDLQQIRLGVRHALSPDSTLIAHATYQRGDFDLSFGSGSRSSIEDDGYTLELQHLLRVGRFSVVSGVGYSDSDRKIVDEFPPDPSFTSTTHIRHLNLYGYSYVNYPRDVTLTVGASIDIFRGGIIDRDQFNPKLGLVWRPTTSTTLRAAAFRTLQRTLISNQTIEPTSVSGFNQLFTDGEGTDAWRYGLGIDQKLSPNLHAGAEVSRRHLEVPGGVGGSPAVVKGTFKEDLARAYLYWTPWSWLAVSGEYQYERLQRPPDFVGEEEFTKIETHRLPLGITVFHPSGVTVRLKGTYVDQNGVFGNPLNAPAVPGADHFWVVDASLSYRLPARWGLITIEARNVLNERFRFQDTDPSNPTISPERLILARFIFAF